MSRGVAIDAGQVTELRAMVRGGASVAEAAAAVGVSRRAAYRHGIRADAPLAAAVGLDAADWTPLCMDADEFDGWRRMNNRIPTLGERAARPCADCPLGHAAEMRALGKCNGTPAGVETEEIEEETAMDQQPAAARAVERLRVDEATQTRVEVAVSAPCGTCAHAPVCALRESLVGLTDVAVRLPKLDEAIGIRLAASVTCEHWQRAKGAIPSRQWTPEARAKQAERVRAMNAKRAAERAEKAADAESVA